MPFVGPTGVLLGAWVPVRWLGVPVLAASAVGVLVLALADRLPRTLLGAVAVLESAVLLVAYQGYGTMPAFGYGLALGIPAILLGVVSLALLRMPRWRLRILGTTSVAAVAGAWSGILTWSNLTHTIATVFSKVVTNQFVYAAILSVVLGLAWAGVAVLTYSATFGRATGWVTRHRRGWTIGAIVCALPYGVLRLAWLTPWQSENLLPGLPHVELDASTRLWGLCLGAACLLGAVLTSGLISQWGEVFPGWIPGLAGRTVPVAVAAVPGFTIATALLAGAPMMMVQFWDDWRTGLVTLVVFPFLPWGILLTLAVWGYVGYRLAHPVAEPRVDLEPDQAEESRHRGCVPLTQRELASEALGGQSARGSQALAHTGPTERP